MNRAAMLAIIKAARKIERGCDCEYDYRCARCEAALELRDAVAAYDRTSPEECVHAWIRCASMSGPEECAHPHSAWRPVVGYVNDQPPPLECTHTHACDENRVPFSECSECEREEARPGCELWCKECGALGWPGEWKLPEVTPLTVVWCKSCGAYQKNDSGWHLPGTDEP